MSRFIPRGVAVAGLGKRFLAAVIDALPPAVVAGGLWAVLQLADSATVILVSTIAAVVLAGGFGLVQWWAYGSRGAGLGARAMGLRLVGMGDGAPIGWWRYFLRQLILAALMATVVGGLALLVFLVIHERRQGWHDIAVRAVLVQPKEREDSRAAPARKGSATSTVGMPPHLTSAFAPSLSAETPLEPMRGFAHRDHAAGPPAWLPRLETEPIISTHPPSAQTMQPVPPPRQQQGQNQPPWGQPQQAPVPPVQQQPPSPGHQATPPPRVNQGWIPLPTPSSVIQPPADPVETPRVRQRDFGEVDDDDGTRIAKPLGVDGARPGDEGWFVRLDDGREVELTVTVLLGRNPQKTQGDPDVHLVPAGGDGRMISRTHVLIATDPRGVYVVDRGSTNGTALVTAGGELEPCPVGTQVRVRDGQQVSYGNRWFTVLRRPQHA